MAWRDGMFASLCSFVKDFSVSVQFQDEHGPNWWFTGVFGPHQVNLKGVFLEELRSVRDTCGGPWLVAGDFNQIYSSKDKNNNNINRALLGRFRRFVNEVELKDIPLVGQKYTWSNEREAPTLVKLDHVFCTASWGDLYPDCILHSNASEISDHCPLSL